MFASLLPATIAGPLAPSLWLAGLTEDCGVLVVLGEHRTRQGGRFEQVLQQPRALHSGVTPTLWLKTTAHARAVDLAAFHAVAAQFNRIAIAP